MAAMITGSRAIKSRRVQQSKPSPHLLLAPSEAVRSPKMRSFSPILSTQTAVKKVSSQVLLLAVGNL